MHSYRFRYSGDADGDGVVTASDALLIARHAMQLQILTGFT